MQGITHILDFRICSDSSNDIHHEKAKYRDPELY